MSSDRFLTHADLLPAMGLLCSSSASEVDKVFGRTDASQVFQDVIKKYNSPLNTVLHPDQMPDKLKDIVTAILADVSEVMVVLKSGQNVRKMGQRPAEAISAMSLPARIEAAHSFGHVILASKQRIAAIKKATSLSTEVQDVMQRYGLWSPLSVVQFGLEVRDGQIRATPEAFNVAKIEAAKRCLEQKFPHARENTTPGAGGSSQTGPSGGSGTDQDASSLIRAQAAEITALRERVGTLLKARIELLEASDDSDDGEEGEEQQHGRGTGQKARSGSTSQNQGGRETYQTKAEKYVGLFRLIQLSNPVTTRKGDIKGLGYSGDMYMPSPPYSG